MNMISTGSFLTETGASNKQSELVKKLTAAWEKKNSKTARAGGASLMALSLAACGGEDNTPFSQADVDAAKAEGVASGVASVDITSDNDAAMTSNDADIAAAAKTEALTAADGTIYATVDAAYTAGSNQSNADAIAVALTDASGVSHASVDAAITSNDASVESAATSAAEASLVAGSGFSTVADLLAAYNAATAPVSGSALELSTSSDTPAMTTADDTVTGVGGTLNDGDIIIDTGGSDTLTATVTSAATMAPTIANVETINLNYSTFGAPTFDASNIVAGTINFAQTQAGASGNITVNNLGSNNTIALGAGITGTATIDLAGAASINAGSAATVNVADLNSDGATITFGTSTTAIELSDRDAAAATDAVTLIGASATGTVTTLDIDAVADDTVENLTLQGNGAALSLDIADANTSADTVETITFQGDQDITVRISAEAITGEVATDNTTAGTTMVRLDTVAAATDVDAVLADIIDVMVDPGAADTITVASGQTVRLSTDTLATASMVIDAAATGAETLNLQLTATQTTSALDVSDFEVININTSPVSTITSALTVSGLTGGATTTAVTVTGSNDLTLTAITADSLTATGMTGDLTVSTNANIDTVTGGEGADTFTIAADGGVTFNGGGGNDLLDITTAQTNTTMVVDGGDGIDTIVVDNANAIGDRYTLSNVEIMRFDANSAVDARDFHNASISLNGVTGTGGTDETLEFDMTNTTSLNLSNVVIDNDSLDVTITGNALGDTITASNAADTINSGGGVDTIVAGEGADIITGAAGADNIDLAEVTAATDTVILTTTDADVVSNFAVGSTNGDQIDITEASFGAIIGGDGSDDTANQAISLETVASGGETAEAADNIFVLDGDFASTAAVKAAIVASGTHEITLAGAATADDDILVLYDNGTNSYLATVNINNAATTIDDHANTTVANILVFEGISDASTFVAANFDLI